MYPAAATSESRPSPGAPHEQPERSTAGRRQKKRIRKKVAGPAAAAVNSGERGWERRQPPSARTSRATATSSRARRQPPARPQLPHTAPKGRAPDLAAGAGGAICATGEGGPPPNHQPSSREPLPSKRPACALRTSEKHVDKKEWIAVRCHHHVVRSPTAPCLQGVAVVKVTPLITGRIVRGADCHQVWHAQSHCIAVLAGTASTLAVLSVAVDCTAAVHAPSLPTTRHVCFFPVLRLFFWVCVFTVRRLPPRLLLFGAPPTSASAASRCVSPSSSAFFLVLPAVLPAVPSRRPPWHGVRGWPPSWTPSSPGASSPPGGPRSG